MTRCSCAQHGATQLELLDWLVNDRGMDQVEASRFLWTNGGADLIWARERALEIVREGLADVLAWLAGAGVPA